MICKNCGKPIDDNSKFCEHCGVTLDETANHTEQEHTEQKAEVTTATTNQAVKKKKNILVFVILIVVIVVIVVACGAGIILFDKYNQKKADDAIQEVQDSYFEFLPEMTVGNLLYAYYGEDYWAYNVDDVVEFWGTNQKDKSGLALDFGPVESDHTVDVTYIKYHKENETAHDITQEEFEEYMLSLYAQLDDNKGTTESAIMQTTTVKTTTKAMTTTALEKQEQAEESKYYLAYLMILNEMDASIKREYGDTYIPYYSYYLYDINHDGFYELLIHLGESEADAQILIYTFDENSEDGFVELGELNGGATILVEKDGKLYSDFSRQGYQVIEEIQMVGQSVTQTTVFEQDGLSEYINYGKAIDRYDISDTSAIEALCPKDLLEDKPYVDGYVETYALSGRDGAKIRLYLSGDFSAVSVQIQNQEYTSDVEFYTREDYDDYIEIAFNTFAQPPSVVYVTPYSDSGVAGNVITCDIPSDISGTIQTGGMSYPVDNMKGQINCHGETVAGFTTDYVVNGGAVGMVRSSLGDTWHVTAKNSCTNYGITWYELWDSDDGDYYGWVDSNYIDFY